MFCSICLDTCQTYTVKMDGCIHHHCLNCFVQWAKVRKTCPMCRNESSNVTIFNGDGKKLKDSSFKNLKKVYGEACPICVEELTGFYVYLDGCNHAHCINCLTDSKECRICGNRNETVRLFNGNRKLISICQISFMRKVEPERWIGSDEEEQI